MISHRLMIALTGAQAGGQSPIFGLLITFVPMILILYFLIIRPQQKKQKDHERMVSQLKKGMHVITSGGLHGTVVGTKEKIVVLKIAENVKVECQKTAVTQVVSEGAEQ